jgi:hypothetical protein
MSLFGSLSLRNPFYYERLKDGSHWYIRTTDTSLLDINDGLKVGLTNPVLQPSLNLIARLFSSAKFSEVNEDLEPVENSTLVELLKKPNLYQSQQDFLEQFIWFKYCFGFMYMYPVHPVGVRTAERATLNNLNTSYIKYDDNFKTPIVFKKSDALKIADQKFTYEDQGNEQKLNLAVKQVIPFYDLANGIASSSYSNSSTNTNNLLTAPSRLLSIQTELSNVHQAGIAKNKAIQTNGRELFSNKNSGVGVAVPLSKPEKLEIERKLNNETGLGSNRSRAIVTNASMEHKSLHIKLLELGLDQSKTADANTILWALGIPLDLADKTSTYENKEQAMLGFMQNNIMPQMNDFTNSLSNYFGLEGTKLIGTYDHLPIMQVIKETELKTIRSKAEVLEILLTSGIDPEEALTLLEWSDLTITPNLKTTGTTTQLATTNNL